MSAKRRCESAWQSAYLDSNYPGCWRHNRPPDLTKRPPAQASRRAGDFEKPSAMREGWGIFVAKSMEDLDLDSIISSEPDVSDHIGSSSKSNFTHPDQVEIDNYGSCPASKHKYMHGPQVPALKFGLTRRTETHLSLWRPRGGKTHAEFSNTKVCRAVYRGRE